MCKGPELVMNSVCLRNRKEADVQARDEVGGQDGEHIMQGSVVWDRELRFHADATQSH